MKNKYSTNVVWNEEDNVFIATCTEFSLLSAYGDTQEEAMAEFQVVLEMAIESYVEDNLELPKPKLSTTHSGQFRIRIPKTLHKNLAETAEQEGVSLNTYAVSLLSEKHAAKTIYSETIDTLDHTVEQLTSSLLPQQQELQIHNQKINFQENPDYPLADDYVISWNSVKAVSKKHKAQAN